MKVKELPLDQRLFLTSAPFSKDVRHFAGSSTRAALPLQVMRLVLTPSGLMVEHADVRRMGQDINTVQDFNQLVIRDFIRHPKVLLYTPFSDSDEYLLKRFRVWDVVGGGPTCILQVGRFSMDADCSVPFSNMSDRLTAL